MHSVVATFNHRALFAETALVQTTGLGECPGPEPVVGPDMEAYVDQVADWTDATACDALIDRLQRGNRHGYVRASVETDDITGLLIACGIGELASVTLRPGPPCLVTVGLKAASVDAVTEILHDLVN